MREISNAEILKNLAVIAGNAEVEYIFDHR
jgi:hypothetical protein